MDIKATESDMKNVLNLYYSWLVDLIGPKGHDKISILSTIVTFDVVKEAPLYTNYIFRQFADRTISISPEDFGPGNTTDRFSRIYRNVVQAAGSELYANARPTDELQMIIDRAAGDVTEAVGEIRNIRRDSLKDWDQHARDAGLKSGTPEYDLEKAKFYQPYISLLKDQRDKIVRAQARKRAAWLAVFRGDRPGQQLSDIYERVTAEESMQALPTDIDTETKYKLDPITIGVAADGGIFAFEKELGISPSGTLTRILDMQGKREQTFKHSDVETHNHDAEWHANASGGWGLWHGHGNAAEETHFRESLNHLESISISCDFMGEYWVNRRDWFNAPILQNKYVLDTLKDDPASVARLAMCISSAIIVRGLKVKYKFKDVVDTAVWSSYKYDAGGGYGAFGIDFGSVSGGTSGGKYDHTVDTTEKSITFYDGTNVCRLLALRVSPLLKIDMRQVEFYTKPLDESQLGRELLHIWDGGDVAPGFVPEEFTISKFE